MPVEFGIKLHVHYISSLPLSVQHREKPLMNMSQTLAHYNYSNQGYIKKTLRNTKLASTSPPWALLLDNDVQRLNDADADVRGSTISLSLSSIF